MIGLRTWALSLAGLAVLTFGAACAGPGSARAPERLVAPTARVVHSEDASVGRVFVVDEGDLRYLRFGSPDGDDQSVISRSDPLAVPMDYVRLAAIGLAHIDPPERVLMIGLGAGTYTTLLYRLLPALQVEAVEISPVVFRVARTYFGLPEDPRYRVHLGDGARFVARAERRYDLILIDAYDGEDLPAALIEPTFFARVRDILRPGGVALLNLAVDDDQEAALVAAFGQAFPRPTCYRTVERENLVVVGHPRNPGPGAPAVRARAAELDRRLDLPFSLAAQAELRVDCPAP